MPVSVGRAYEGGFLKSRTVQLTFLGVHSNVGKEYAPPPLHGVFWLTAFAEPRISEILLPGLI